MHIGIKYTFIAHVWRYSGQAGWYFVSMPEDMSAEIRAHLKWQESGWGRLQVTASIGPHEWKTAIWFDTKKNTYLLPLKAEVRKKCRLKESDAVDVVLYV
jgi:hypothetical protein